MVKLDEFLPEDLNIDFIKIDIQGYEFEAIRGMQRIIIKYKPTILMEFWPLGLISNNENPLNFLEYLHSFNYDIFSLPDSCDNFNLQKIDVSQYMTIANTMKNDFNIVLKNRI
jgi:hypothetical protein